MKNKNSKIIVGTAQFIKKYGINRKTSYFKNKSDYLNEIYQSGCYGIDTALNYENAQKSVGVWLKNNKYKTRIFTKIPDVSANSSLDLLFKKCQDELNLNKIEGLFLHNQHDWNKKEVQSFASKLLEKKLVRYFGLSIYDKSAIPKHNDIKILQVPGSIFNQDLLISNELNSFIESGGKVHVRSIFVQGLILMKLEKIPKHLKDLVKPIKIFQNIALEAEVDPISLAIQSVYKLCPKCKLVLGANSSKQLKETLNKSKVYVNNAVIEEVLKISKKFSGKRWDPRFWIK